MTNLLLFLSLYFSRCSLFTLCQMVIASCLTLFGSTGFDPACLGLSFSVSSLGNPTTFPTKSLFLRVDVLPWPRGVFCDYCCAVAHKSPIKPWWWLTVHNCCAVSVSDHTHVSERQCIWGCLGFWDCQAAFPGPLDTKMAHSFQGKLLIDAEQDRAADFRCTLICPVATSWTTENPPVTHKALFSMGYYWKRDSLKLFAGHLHINMNTAKLIIVKNHSIKAQKKILHLIFHDSSVWLGTMSQVHWVRKFPHIPRFHIIVCPTASAQ